MIRAVFPALILLVMTVSCRQVEIVADDGHIEFMPFYTIDESVSPDTEVEDWLQPFRRAYHREMSHPVATASGAFRIGKPESTLGNLVADMIRYRATHEMQTYVHLALIDEERFMIELDEGEITLGDIYELMPYDYSLIVLELNGSVLNGVTRRSVIELAESQGIDVRERRISIDEVMQAGRDGSLEEVFGSGTAAVISPVSLIHHDGQKVEVGDGTIGPMARTFYDTITGIQYGEIEDSFGWMHPVKITDSARVS